MHAYSTKLNKLFILLLIPLFTSWANANDCEQPCQQKVVDAYFKNLSSIYRLGSKASDIELLFSSLAPSVRYEHLNYEASFNRDEWKAAFLNNLDRGAYKNAENQSIRVDQYIHGKGFVAVSYSYGFTDKNGSWKPKGDQNLLALFKITNGKISSVKEYW